MCRGSEHIAAPARRPLAEILTTIAARLAAQHGVSPADVRIGPVDFGSSCEAERAR